jgi:hypothetical protein
MRRDELTTADLAGNREQGRGRQDEGIVNRGDRPLDAPPPGGPAPAAAGTRSPAAAAHDRGNNPAAHDVARATQDVVRETSDRTPDRATMAPPAAHAPLFAEDQAARFHSRWTDIQAAFVDEPRSAVERADGLVAEVMRQLAEGFASERAALERGWDRGDQVTTEDLRIALQKYRSFFDRLLKI